MSHNITDRDGMFTVREPAWHGLGMVLPDHPTRYEAQRIAHNWEPITEPVYRRVPMVSLSTGSPLSVTYEMIEGQQAVVRSDTGDTLGVVSDTYEPVDNTEMYEIAEAIESGDPDSVMYETGGSLLGGKKVWLLLRLREPIVIPGDSSATIPYYALQNDHVGGGAFRGQGLATRIVCDNTATYADTEAQQRGTEFVFRHTKNVGARIAQARQALTSWRQGLVTYTDNMAELMRTSAPPHVRDRFIQTFIPDPPPHMVSARVIANILDARDVLHRILEGPTCEGISGTAYGLVQASIEYNQHYRKAKSNQSRFKRAYLDRSRVTSDAVEIARAVCA